MVDIWKGFHFSVHSLGYVVYTSSLQSVQNHPVTGLLTERNYITKRYVVRILSLTPLVKGENMEKFKHSTHEVILISGELYLTVARCHHCCQWSDRVPFSPAHFMRLIRCLSMHANEPFVDGKSRKPGRTKRELRMCQLLRGFPKVCTLWCQIRTGRSLLGPVVEYTRVFL